ALAEGFQLEDLTIDLYALQRLQPVLREDNWRITATVWNDSAVIDVQPGYQEGVYGLAVDVGSTTVASYLSDLRTGELLATESLMNPQVSFGEDLMSRVSYSLNHRNGLKKMNAAIIQTINQLAAAAARQAGIRARNIQEITLVGNTTMTHILLNVPPDQLGSSPFALANRDAMDLRASELGLKLHPGARAHILPAQAGHVGADNVAVLIAEQPYLDEEVILTIDVGTNAEIVLTHGSTMYSASSPTGPAFEGGQISSGMRAAPGAIERVRIDPETKMPRFRVIGEEEWSDAWKVGPDVPLEDQPKHLAAGICGSGIIEAVAELFSAGLITSSGRFDPRVDCDRVLWEEDSRTGSYILAEADKTASGKPLLITQLDIRNIQLAKAALYAGAKLLMKRAEVEKVDKVILAGAFGSYINPEHALMLGLFPDCSLESIHSVGNAAGDGARIALLDRERRQEAQRIARIVRYIETAVDSDFQDQFVGAMHIPHQEDKFEHLAGLLPESTTPLRRKRRFKRPRKGQ
ncbi:MAG: ASKHA domain-containing protein, partial [Anaerolineales bacterium]